MFTLKICQSHSVYKEHLSNTTLTRLCWNILPSPILSKELNGFWYYMKKLRSCLIDAFGSQENKQTNKQTNIDGFQAAENMVFVHHIHSLLNLVECINLMLNIFNKSVLSTCIFVNFIGETMLYWKYFISLTVFLGLLGCEISRQVEK